MKIAQEQNQTGCAAAMAAEIPVGTHRAAPTVGSFRWCRVSALAAGAALSLLLLGMARIPERIPEAAVAPYGCGWELSYRSTPAWTGWRWVGGRAHRFAATQQTDTFALGITSTAVRNHRGLIEFRESGMWRAGAAMPQWRKCSGGLP